MASTPENQKPSLSEILKTKTGLYFMDLPANINETDLQLYLQNYNDSITNIQIIMKTFTDVKKTVTRRALVKCIDHESAKKILTEMNQKRLKNFPVRILWDDRSAASLNMNANNLFVKNINKSKEPREIYEFFMQFGDIYSLKLQSFDGQNHIGNAYIDYIRKEDAEKCLKECNGKNFLGSILEIEMFNTKKNKDLVNNNNVSAPMNAQFNNNPANNYKPPSNFPASKNFIKPNFKPYKKSYASDNEKLQLLIKNVPKNLSEEQLVRYFGQIGYIKGLKFEATTKTQFMGGDFSGECTVNKGFAYLSYYTNEEALQAVLLLNNTYIPGTCWFAPLEVVFLNPENLKCTMIDNIPIIYNSYSDNIEELNDKIYYAINDYLAGLKKYEEDEINDLASKITGMLIEETNIDYLNALVCSKKFLEKKILEAKDLLHK